MERLEINRRHMALLNINDQEVEKIRLAQALPVEDLQNCLGANQLLVDAFLIINERLAVGASRLKKINEQAKATSRQTMNRLVRAKYESQDRNNAIAANDAAKAAWIKGGSQGEFTPPHDVSRFADVSDLTIVDPSKLTDDARKSIAEGVVNERHFGDDYNDLVEAVEILSQIKDTVINIGKLTSTNVTGFGTLNKITNGR